MDHHPTAIAQVIARATVATGYAVRSYVEDGVQYAHVVAPDVSGDWPRCQVVGGHAKRIGAPTTLFGGELDQRVHPQVVLLFREARRPPLVLDVVSNPEIVLANTARDPTESDPYTTTSNGTLGDHIVAAGGSALTVSGDGTMTVSPKGQLSVAIEAAPMRIFQSGESGDAIPGANTTADQMNTIANSVNALTLRVQTIEDVVTAGLGSIIEALNSLLPGPDALLPFAFPVPDVALAILAQIDGGDLAAPGITIPSKGA